MVLSVDDDADLQVLALNAASAALYVSDIDINNSVTAVRMAKIDGEIVVNPTASELKESTLDLYLSGSKDDILMIEMKTQGSVDVEMLNASIVDPMIDPSLGVDVMSEYDSNAMGESELVEVSAKAQEELKSANSAYESSFAEYKKPTQSLILKEDSDSQEMMNFLRENYSQKIKKA